MQRITLKAYNTTSGSIRGDEAMPFIIRGLPIALSRFQATQPQIKNWPLK